MLLARYLHFYRPVFVIIGQPPPSPVASHCLNVFYIYYTLPKNLPKRMIRQLSIAGFTLVELIAALILIGVLAATALPRFISLSEEAHIAVVETTAGALQSSVTIAHTVWRIHGNGRVANDLAEYADGTWLFNASGFPVEGADRAAIGNSDLNTNPNHNRCGRIWNGLLDHNPPLDVSGIGSRVNGQHPYYYSIAGGTFAVTRAGSTACEYTYVEEPSYKIQYNFLVGTVTHTL